MKPFKSILVALAIVPSFSIVNPAAAGESLTVRGLVLQPGFPRELHAHDASGNSTAGQVEVKSYLNHESNVLKPESDQLVFTQVMRPISASDVNEVVGQLKVPANLKSAILLFIPENTDLNAPKCQVQAVDDSTKEFPAGSFKVTNFTDAEAKIVLDGSEILIPAGESKVILKLKYNEQESIGMAAYSKKGEEWETVTTGSWTNPGTRRVLEVLYKDPKRDKIMLKGVIDMPVK